MRTLIADLRHAARALRRSPGFTLSAVVVLAVGIGASTSIFSVVDHVLFRPLDIPEAERVVTVCEANEARDYCYGASTPTIADWLAETRTIEEMGAARPRTYTVDAGTEREWASVGLAMPGFLRAVGARTARGRLIGESDLPPEGDPRVVVVSHGFWRTELGGDPSVVGRTLLLDDEPHTVVGVLEAGTTVPRLDWVRLWAPLPWNPRLEENRDWRGLATAARLAPGVDVEEAEAELSALYAALAEVHPEELRGWTVRVRSMRAYLVGGTRDTLLVFLGAVALLLLIVCVNMASLLLTRATARERELAVRSALGAGRWALARHVLAESVLLAVAGGLGGALIAVWTTDLFLTLAPAGIPRIDEVAVDGRIFAFTAGVSMAAGLIFGAAPMARAGTVRMARLLRDGRSPGSGRAGGRLRKGLVVGQVALAVVLVVSAGLLIRSFGNLVDWDPGFDTSDVVTFQLFVPPGSRGGDEALGSFWTEVEAAVEGVSGVRAAATTSGGPLLPGGDGVTPFFVEGRRNPPVDAAPTVAWFNVAPDFFGTLGVPLVRGRTLRETDRSGSPPVALVNQAMAERHWLDGDAVGSRLRLPEQDRSVEIVGVVRDVPPLDPGTATPPELYFTNRQYPRGAAYVVVRAEGAPSALVPRLENAVASLHPDLRPSGVRTLDARLRGRLVAPRFNAVLVGVFALVALLLGMVGVYGVVAYAVELREHEIGIRMALGADAGEVVRWVLARGFVLVAVGAVVGLVAAVELTGLLSDLLHGVEPTDPVTFAGAAAVLIGAGLAAVVIPAVRASRTSPLIALREG